MQAAKCLELRISADLMQEEAFDELAISLQALGQAVETEADSGDCEYIAWFAMDEDEQASRGRLAAAMLLAGMDETSFTLTTLERQGWETAWQKDWHAMPVGERLWVRPSFCDGPSDGRVDIVLDPGMAFGTGTHPTTRLCLEAIERVCREQAPQTLLDMGAGSGLLAIAALKLGAASALAIDMETDSVEACRENALINGVELEVQLDDTPPARRFELVVANILAAPLVWMAAELAACVDQRLILSGLLTTQVDDVAAAYIAEGLVEVRRDSQEEWASVELVRP
ncbi:50S ribosomal protein L11 methyltransferase [Mariprofundus erugo]|uniref:Ribosomal protein L11 methyltransferase n=1 Tax=Mariprofundus erugo TaxID=2528639 RepID=A0A5R9GQD2_9PROT|nr:50S ribosomal protein L11 methyltransferase [Mariprofundus erugo]TLS68501.1 50S ribosomal protein L11 methyltransferase [Mariprofundus erugo]TLS76858.1 50S ribosomal protein L11 methyltransferase [Mariprofundus erugo]